MYVRELMTLDPATVTPDSTLSDAASAMAEGDFGVLPVVENGEVIGVVTDRDICMAVTREGKGPRTRIRAITRRPAHLCSTEDDVTEALAMMRSHRVRRLPVVDGEGHLEGMLSMNDAVLAARPHPETDGSPSYEQIVQTMRRICEHRSYPAVAQS
jgi:CBS domain-containing protein